LKIGNKDGKMNFKEFAEKNILVLDGAMGTQLQKHGLKAGESPESFNINQSEIVKQVHLSYLRAGANMILTNTFGANKRKLRGLDSDEVIKKAVGVAKNVASQFSAYTVLNIGPIGELLEPMGTLKFDEAYELFARQVLTGTKEGADAIYIETMTDLYEAKCAVLAAKENCALPVFCTMSFEKNKRTFVGVNISSAALTLQGLGADFIGINCSVGPKEMYEMAQELIKWTHLPIVIKPNAGLPKFINGQTVFDIEPGEFANNMNRILDLGVSVIGGCCGTTPEFIEKLAVFAKDKKPVRRNPLDLSVVCSASKTVLIDRVRIIGERINPTGKKRFQAAILENDMDYIVSQAIEQTESGADILDVNVGVPKIDEEKIMTDVIKNIQAVVSVPLQIDSTKPEVIEAGLRAYNGKAIVNSVNGEESSLNIILPIVKKYGAAVIGLTLDQNGIPKTAEERLKIAEKIINTAASFGIPKHDVFIDCLTLTSGAEQEIAYETLNAVKFVKEKLGVKTILGVSNISFGLPARDKLNQTFLTLAMANGLDLAIINPNNTDTVDNIYCYHQLKNIDKDSIEYINRFKTTEEIKPKTAETLFSENDISYCINNGMKEEIISAVNNLLTRHPPLDVINNFLIPVLDDIGKKYESGEIFLPQLLSSAEAAKAAFEIVKTKIPASDTNIKEKIILATVKGDIHDIGKNIVKVLLENYGYTVIDMGKDVEIEKVAQEAVKNGVKLVGLSALMTTTLENMETTIAAIKKANENIAVMTGGAVLTEQYAKKIGADFYGKDAMSAVAIAKKVLG